MKKTNEERIGDALDRIEMYTAQLAAGRFERTGFDLLNAPGHDCIWCPKCEIVRNQARASAGEEPECADGEHKAIDGIARARKLVLKLATAAHADGSAQQLDEGFDFGGMTHRCDKVTLGAVLLLNSMDGEHKADVMRATIGFAIEARRCEIVGEAASDEVQA